MAIGYTLGASYLLDLKDKKSLDPSYNPNDVLAVQQIIKKILLWKWF